MNILFCQIFIWLVGLSGLEPPTSRLSGARSNLLSYAPIVFWVTIAVWRSLKIEQQKTLDLRIPTETFSP